MQKGYWVSCYREIYDPNKLSAYAELAKLVVESRGGRFLVRGLSIYASGSGLLERTVIVEWPTLDAAQSAYDSDAYQAALDALSDGVDRDFRIVEGV
ncbi:MAG: DUF1330 domain-containing protein [Pseudomonadota bacterium]|nr:DUF1330 domain-containing protein [Pseudomonadota bacterium]|tara:strand:- start:325 stop:615 length:291 start_codon:yes stop_codon:yes gene_type:complete